MGRLPTTLYRADQCRELDRIAMTQFDLGDGVLMARAGDAAFRCLRSRWPGAHRLVVVAGPGNNGGDGYVVARLAKEAGLDSLVAYVGDPERQQGDALAAREQAGATGVAIRPFGKELLTNADLVVDALFGTGLARAAEGVWREAIEAMNACAAPVQALDIPSGLHVDSGSLPGVAVRAEQTVCFIALKAGMFTADGPDCCGEILFDDLEVPGEVFRAMTPHATRITAGTVTGLLPPRPRNTHKGDAGRVLVIGGGPGMAGAVQLAGVAAYRAGAGLVTVATTPGHASGLPVAHPELIVHAAADRAALRALAAPVDAVAIGPGLGQSPWAQELLAAVLELRLPTVVDADALNLLAREPWQADFWILTPHPAEAARMLRCTTADVQADRYQATQALVEAYGGVVVLKGAGTVVARHGQLAVCDAGHPVLATAGTGDVLTGVIAGLLGQGLEPWDAARMGVFIHARGGELLGREGARGGMASDLMPLLRRVLNGLVARD